MRRNPAARRAFTLVEVLIVVVIMAILAAVVVPKFFDSVEDADVAVALNNLQNMRLIIERYRGSHHGSLPSASLAELINRTNAKGEMGATVQYPYGPYLTDIPTNPFNGLFSVRVIADAKPTLSEATGAYGWLYHPATGRIFLDDPKYYTT